jgi:hypothetical protein
VISLQISNLTAALANGRERFKSVVTLRERRMVKIFGPALWTQINGSGAGGRGGGAGSDEVFWEDREPLTMDGFCRSVALSTEATEPAVVGDCFHSPRVLGVCTAVEAVVPTPECGSAEEICCQGRAIGLCVLPRAYSVSTSVG